MADQERLYAAGSNGQMAAIRLADWQLTWRRDLGQTVTAGLAADTRYVYAATSDGQVLAVRADNGRVARRWRLGAPVTGSLVVAARRVPAGTQSLVIAGLGDGRIIALAAPK